MSGLDLMQALSVAQSAAFAAGELIDQHFRRGVDTRFKADDSPVTQADEDSEARIRAILQRHYPAHGIYGEEGGQHHLDAEYLWLVDPIDGTKSFVRGSPIFSTQIALMHRGELVLGVSYASSWREMAWAVRGRGAWVDGRPARVAEFPLQRATLSTGNLKSLIADPRRYLALGELIRASHRGRGYGDFLHYHDLARGRIDLVIESDVNILDIAALVVIVREAGGVFTDLDGAPIGLGTRSVLAGSPALHAEALARLR